MTDREQKLIYPLYNIVRGRRSCEIIDVLWREGLLNRVEVEKRYFVREVERRVREGQVKRRAMVDVAREAECSFEKVRLALYKTKIRKKN